MNTTKLSNYQIQSIKSAIADCDRYIAKESPRNPKLRPTEIEKLLNWYIAHRAKLASMLEADWRNKNAQVR